MNAFFQSSVGILAVMSFLAAPPQTLAEAARREALRRQEAPKSKIVLTNLGLPAGQPPSSIVPASLSPSEVPAPAQAIDKAAQADPQAGEKGTEPVKKDEQWWRKRIADARETLAKDQAMVSGLQTRINELKSEVVNRDSPMQRNKLQQELDAKLAQLDATNKKIVADQKAITDIQDEARREGVPAGWTR